MTTVDSQLELLARDDAISASTVAAVRTVGLCKTIDDRPILRKIDLEIPQGSYLTLLGANGAGKSTLLHTLATLTGFTAGELCLFGQNVARQSSAKARARIGMIGHQPMLYRELSARENLLFFGRLYRVERADKRAADLLEMVGLAHRASDQAKTFSRGMVQRLAIARALMHDPDLLLADEPFAGLDVPSTQRVEELLAALHLQGKTIVLTNHDLGQSLRLAQRVVVLRQGSVVIDQATAITAVADVLQEVTTS